MMGASSSAMHATRRRSASRRQSSSLMEKSLTSPLPEDHKASFVKDQDKEAENMASQKSSQTRGLSMASNKDEPIVTNDQDPVENTRSKDNKSSTKQIDFNTALKDLNLLEHECQSAQALKKKNEDITDALLICIKAVKSLTSGDATDVLLYLENINFKFFEVEFEKRSLIGDFLKLINYGQASFKKYKQLLKSMDMEVFNEKDLSDTEQSQIIYLLRSHWWNFADCSTNFGTMLVTHGIIQEMILDLQNMINIDEKTLKYSFTFESAIGVLHNVAKIQSHRQTFRDLKLVDILGNFLNYEKLPKITMLVLLTLALIIDEDKTHLLFSHETSFDLLILLANRAWKMDDHRYDGFSCEELISGLKGLSKNEKVKRLLVEKGILDLVSKVLIDGRDDEKEVTAKLLWELSFDPENGTLILKDEKIMTTLKSLSSDSLGTIARTAQGVLWVLEMKKIRDKKKVKGSSKKKKLTNETDGTSRGHIMISYNWSHQEQLIKVKDALKSEGFIVWMDIENISGSTLQAMAEAVEGSAIVLVCMSEKYKESINCRSEAEYAFSLTKPIIPLLMQESYKPDGWLGMLLGTKVFFDFSGRFSFESKMSELIKDLTKRGMNANYEDVTDGPIVKTAAPLVGKAPKPSLSDFDVKKWVSEHKLDKYPLFTSLETAHLQFLKKLSFKVPEFYHGLLKDILSGKMTLENLNDLIQVKAAFDKVPT